MNINLKCLKRFEGESGSAIVIAVVAGFLLSTIAIGVLFLVSGQIDITNAQRSSTKALNAAEAGINKALFTMKTSGKREFDPAYISANFPLTGSISEGDRTGSYVVEAHMPSTIADTARIKLTSTGQISGEAKRVVEVDAWIMDFWKQGYSEEGIDSLQGNAEMIGRFYTRNDFILDRGGAGIKKGPLLVRGDVSIDNAAAFVGFNQGSETEHDWGAIDLFLDGSYGGNMSRYWLNNVEPWVPDLKLPPVNMNNLRTLAIANGNTVYDNNLTLPPRGKGSTFKFGNFTYTMNTNFTFAYDLSVPVVQSYEAAADGEDNIYILDTAADPIVKRASATGGINQSWGSGTFVSPRAIAVDTSSFVYVSDSGTQNIYKINISNGNIDTWSGFNNPKGIALNPAGTVLYVADNTSGGRVRAFYTSNGTELAPAAFNSINIASPVDVAVAVNGNLFVAKNWTAVNNKAKVRVYNSSGNYLNNEFGDTGPNPLEEPRGVALSMDGQYVLISDYNIPPPNPGYSRIIRYTTQGASPEEGFTSTLGSYQGIQFDSSGNLLLADSNSTAINRYKKISDGITLCGVAYIRGDLILQGPIVYSHLSGCQSGALIAVEGKITINGRGANRYFRPDKSVFNTADKNLYEIEDNHKITAGFGLVVAEGAVRTGGDVGVFDVKASNMGAYDEPNFAGLVYAQKDMTSAGPFLYRGILAAKALTFEQVPKIYFQPQSRLPVGLPGTEVQVYIGSWNEP